MSGALPCGGILQGCLCSSAQFPAARRMSCSRLLAPLLCVRRWCDVGRQRGSRFHAAPTMLEVGTVNASLCVTALASSTSGHWLVVLPWRVGACVAHGHGQHNKVDSGKVKAMIYFKSVGAGGKGQFSGTLGVDVNVHNYVYPHARLHLNLYIWPHVYRYEDAYALSVCMCACTYGWADGCTCVSINKSIWRSTYSRGYTKMYMCIYVSANNDMYCTA